MGNARLPYPLNIVYDFGRTKNAVTKTRNIASTVPAMSAMFVSSYMAAGMRSVTALPGPYPGLVEGNDSFDMSVMTHKIHSADPDYLDGAFAEVTYPQGSEQLQEMS